jgi:hypothetical protein
MTPEDRAHAVLCLSSWDHLTDMEMIRFGEMLAKAIRDAIAEEREACAKIIRDAYRGMEFCLEPHDCTALQRLEAAILGRA